MIKKGSHGKEKGLWIPDQEKILLNLLRICYYYLFILLLFVKNSDEIEIKMYAYTSLHCLDWHISCSSLTKDAVKVRF